MAVEPACRRLVKTSLERHGLCRRRLEKLPPMILAPGALATDRPQVLLSAVLDGLAIAACDDGGRPCRNVRPEVGAHVGDPNLAAQADVKTDRRDQVIFVGGCEPDGSFDRAMRGPPSLHARCIGGRGGRGLPGTANRADAARPIAAATPHLSDVCGRPRAMTLFIIRRQERASLKRKRAPIRQGNLFRHIVDADVFVSRQV